MQPTAKVLKTGSRPPSFPPEHGSHSARIQTSCVVDGPRAQPCRVTALNNGGTDEKPVDSRTPAPRRGPSVVLGVSLGAAAPPRVQFTDTQLKNGLRVIIAEDHSAPVFSIAITYNVGSRNERPGRTGFAHLFEHMMFKGSPNVGSGEHFLLIYTNGKLKTF